MCRSRLRLQYHGGLSEWVLLFSQWAKTGVGRQGRFGAR
jgi:hypothetical protein